MRGWMNGLCAVSVAIAMGGGALAEEDKDAKPVNAGPGNMMHCPNVVNGASVAIKDIKDGVEFTITAANEKATTEIRRRAKHLVEAAKTDPESVRHTGDGHGGGGIGKCPIVLKDTFITAEEIKGGARVTVKSIKPVDVAWLRKESQTRHKQMQSIK